LAGKGWWAAATADQTTLNYADDLVLMSRDSEELAQLLKVFDSVCKIMGLRG
jgi:hypothetical protein